MCIRDRSGSDCLQNLGTSHFLWSSAVSSAVQFALRSSLFSSSFQWWRLHSAPCERSRDRTERRKKLKRVRLNPSEGGKETWSRGRKNTRIFDTYKIELSFWVRREMMRFLRRTLSTCGRHRDHDDDASDQRKRVSFTSRKPEIDAAFKRRVLSSVPMTCHDITTVETAIVHLLFKWNPDPRPLIPPAG